ncbi:hypothetical protein OsI_00938 [Oryza sativa Indica Group]|uniref:Uncharacterized protein n=1 Tax=Oryza sativa subsp. indica TaxID=39946 RepID=B8AAM0_ORYSI|nr:hypothetical protein OsI_00938 [Oryza sativa Indica Group]
MSWPKQQWRFQTLLELMPAASSSWKRALDTVASDPAASPGFLFPEAATVIGVSQTMSVHAARRRFLRLDAPCRDCGGAAAAGSFPGCLSAQTRRRSGTQLVNEESLRSLFLLSSALASRSS